MSYFDDLLAAQQAGPPTGQQNQTFPMQPQGGIGGYPVASLPPTTQPGMNAMPAMSPLANGQGGLLGMPQQPGGIGAMNGGLLGKLMPANPVMEGIQSPEDIQTARRMGLLSGAASLLGASGSQGSSFGRIMPAPTTAQAIGEALKAMSGGFHGTLESRMQQGQEASQIAQQRNLIATRQALMGDTAQKPGEDPKAWLDRIDAAAMKLAAAGDDAGSQALARLANANRDRLGIGSSGRYTAVPLGDRAGIFDKTTGQFIGYTPRGEDPGKVDELKIRKAALDEANYKFGATQDEGAQRQFTTRNSKNIEEINNIAQVNTLIEQAKAGNQSMTGILPGAIAGILDPKARLGPSILEKVSKYDPSLIGRLYQYGQQGYSGTIPAYDLQNLQKAMLDVYKSRRDIVDQDYQKTAAARPGFANLEAPTYKNPQLEALLESQKPAATAATPAAKGDASKIRKRLSEVP